MEPIRLTVDEEKTILSQLMSCEEIGQGSSRTVFRPNDELCKMPFFQKHPNCVIKLGYGCGGWVQNNRELKFFTKFGNSAPLAWIYAYGQSIIIMEEVGGLGLDRDSIDEAWNCGCDADEFVDTIYEWYGDDDEELDERLLYSIYYAYSDLTELFGCTEDNSQIGLTDDGRVVAYDYGYSSINRSQSQVSDYNHPCQEYIDYLISYLERGINFAIMNRYDS